MVFFIKIYFLNLDTIQTIVILIHHPKGFLESRFETFLEKSGALPNTQLNSWNFENMIHEWYVILKDYGP